MQQMDATVNSLLTISKTLKNYLQNCPKNVYK